MRRWFAVIAIVALVTIGLLAALWSTQRRLVYFPSPGPVPSAATVLPGGRDVELTTADGIRLGAWYFPGPRRSAVLVLHGNAGDRSMRAPLAVALNRMGLPVLLFDYRGYGGNPGRPTEAGLAADARAAQEWLAASPGVDRVAYFGESLGAAVAVGLAVDKPPAALVLRSPFTSLADVGAVHYPWLPVRWLLLDRYPSIERIPSVTAPLLVIAGGRDNIVPTALSRRLYDAATASKHWLLVPGAGHNDPVFLDGRQLIAELEHFLSTTGMT